MLPLVGVTTACQRTTLGLKLGRLLPGLGCPRLPSFLCFFAQRRDLWPTRQALARVTGLLHRVSWFNPLLVRGPIGFVPDLALVVVFSIPDRRDRFALAFGPFAVFFLLLERLGTLGLRKLIGVVRKVNSPIFVRPGVGLSLRQARQGEQAGQTQDLDAQTAHTQPL